MWIQKIISLKETSDFSCFWKCYVLAKLLCLWSGGRVSLESRGSVWCLIGLLWNLRKLIRDSRFVRTVRDLISFSLFSVYSYFSQRSHSKVSILLSSGARYHPAVTNPHPALGSYPSPSSSQTEVPTHILPWVPTLHPLPPRQKYQPTARGKDNIMHSQSPNNGILKNNCCNIPFQTKHIS